MKNIVNEIAYSLNKEEFESYYRLHTKKQCCEKFNFHERYFYRILKILNISKHTKEEICYINKYYGCTPKRNRKVGLSHKGLKRSEIAKQHMSVAAKNRDNSLFVLMGEKTRFKKGQIPWNKGLTKETDERVAKCEEHRIKTMVDRYGAISILKGGISNPEKIYKEYLISIFGSDDIFTNYSGDVRYPYHCDFYIKSLDLFIELNLFPTHGPHRYDPNNIDDIELSKTILDKDIWTIKDYNKIQTAIKNKINYITIYPDEWYKEILPNILKSQAIL